MGNGEFAFTTDATGLQTFPDLYDKVMPLCTQSQWGWHSFPNPKGFTLAGLEPTLYDTHGREAGYPTSGKGQEEIYHWLRDNPHRLNLARIGLRLEADASDLTEIRQILNLWTGLLRSTFAVRGKRVTVETCCHPTQDLLAVRIHGGSAVFFEFPYGSTAMNASGWTEPDRHKSELVTRAEIRRTLDADGYTVALGWTGPAALKQEAQHRFILSTAIDTLAFTVRFSRLPIPQALPTVAQTQAAAADHWSRFWSEGAALELAHAPDSRAKEIERRVVLSQYLTAIQCAGSLPPQETGLTCNSWNGKFHMEMYFWHAAHFALWKRTPLLERSMGFYHAILASALQTAKGQGYAGARWPKMTAGGGADAGRESPSPIGPLLIWQQPHPIWMAEAIYRAQPGRPTLDRYAEVVFASAEFMASYAYYEEARQRYVLGPPVIPAQENHPPRETWNPAFELEYWAFGLKTAQTWRRRLGLAPEPKWDAVRNQLSALAVKDGLYLAHENCPQTFTERNRDHPSMLAALGLLAGTKADAAIMKRTLHKVLEVWKWPDTWGWDYPMVAMTAASVGEPEAAVDALMMDTPKNRWSPNGHTWQRPNLPVYLPSNGALLLGAAMMANHSGFPSSWSVRSEGLTFFR